MNKLKQSLYWQLTLLRDKRIPEWLRTIIDDIRDYLM